VCNGRIAALAGGSTGPDRTSSTNIHNPGVFTAGKSTHGWPRGQDTGLSGGLGRGRPSQESTGTDAGAAAAATPQAWARRRPLSPGARSPDLAEPTVTTPRTTLIPLSEDSARSVIFVLRLRVQPMLVYLRRYYAALLPRRGRILRRTLSVCLSVRPFVYRYRASRGAT